MTTESLGGDLWQLHTGLNRGGGLCQLIDPIALAKSGKMVEIERKYRLPVRRQDIDREIAMLFAKVGDFITTNKLSVESLTTFVGIDQYYIFGGPKGAEYHFRYRSGANRPPQLTVKYQLERASNVVRGEINVGVETANPNSVRAFMSVIALMSGQKPVTFAVQQSGVIWVIFDPLTGQRVEIVVYRVRRITQTELHGAFVEIEALHTKDASVALSIIGRYENGLKLKSKRCSRSIAEIFRP